MLTYRPQPPEKLSAPRYLARFQCTAEKCPDTCCAGAGAIQPSLTSAELERLEAALRDTEAGAELLARAIDRGGAPEGAAAAVAHPGGRCAFLDAGERCQVFARAPAALPDACLRYPRAFTVLADGRVEVVGKLGCPEMARLALTGDEGLEPVAAPGTISSLYPHLDGVAGTSPYGAPFDEVRGFGAAWLGSAAPLRVRLLSLADFGSRVDGSFHREAEAVDLKELRAARAAVDAPARQAELEALATADPLPVVAQVVASTLMSAEDNTGNARLSDLIVSALTVYQDGAKAWNERCGEPGGPSLWEGVAVAYGTSRPRVAQALGDILEPILARYCLNDWYREAYLGAPTFGERALLLLYRAALLRFLLVGHPDLRMYTEEVIDQDEPLDERSRGFALRYALDAVQVFARHLEANLPLIRASLNLLPPGDLLARATALAAFVG